MKIEKRDVKWLYKWIQLYDQLEVQSKIKEHAWALNLNLLQRGKMCWTIRWCYFLWASLDHSQLIYI
jgi:hypothetical protein